MKYSKLIAGILCTLILFTSVSIVSADYLGEITARQDDTVIIQYHGKTGIKISGDADNTTYASSGTPSHQFTDAELNAQSDKQGVINTLKDWMNAAGGFPAYSGDATIPTVTKKESNGSSAGIDGGQNNSNDGSSNSGANNSTGGSNSESGSSNESGGSESTNNSNSSTGHSNKPTSSDKKANLNDLVITQSTGGQYKKKQVIGGYNNSSDMVTVGLIQAQDSALEELLKQVDSFSQNLGQDNVDSIFNTQSYDYGTLPSRNLISSKEDLNSVNMMTDKEIKQAKKAIAKNEGLKWTYTDGSASQFNGYNNRKYSFVADPTRGIYTDPMLPQYMTKDFVGIRTDLFSDGLRDSVNWADRFSGLNRFTSNAMEDYATLVCVTDYHIQSVQYNYVIAEDYTSDERCWVITKANDNNVIDAKITDGALHEFEMEMSNYLPGEYWVHPAQWKTYQTGMYVTYDVVDYLYDAETNQILYFNEKLVSNGNGGAVLVNAKEESGWIFDDDEFYYKIINDDLDGLQNNKEDIQNNGVQRIE